MGQSMERMKKLIEEKKRAAQKKGNTPVPAKKLGQTAKGRSSKKSGGHFDK